MGARSRNGFTLIEILVALAIAAVVIGSAYTLLVYCKKRHSRRICKDAGEGAGL